MTTDRSGEGTPFTDAFHGGWDSYNYPMEAIDFARSLERALSAAKAERVAVAERCAEICWHTWSNADNSSEGGYVQNAVAAGCLASAAAIRAYAKTLAESK